MSDDLLARLSADLKPVSPLRVVRRLLLGAAVGAAASMVLTLLTLGLRADMAQAMAERMFWMKLAYTLAFAGLGLWVCERLARPASHPHARWPWLLLPLAILAGLAAWQLSQAPAPMRMPLMMGASARFCPWCILIFALPPFAGLTWAVRGLAPTRLRWTGLMIGLASGGAGAAAYCLHCPESAAPFLVIWYSLGIALAGLLGWLTGPRLLRW